MQINRHIDPKRQIAIAVVTGTITVAEVRADVMQLASTPYAGSDMPGLIDMRNATAGLNADDLLEIAETVKRARAIGRTRRALLVGNDLMFGLYRMFASFATGGATEYRVFRDEDQALAWLAGKEADVEPLNS